MTVANRPTVNTHVLHVVMLVFPIEGLHVTSIVQIVCLTTFVRLTFVRFTFQLNVMGQMHLLGHHALPNKRISVKS